MAATKTISLRIPTVYLFEVLGPFESSLERLFVPRLYSFTSRHTQNIDKCMGVLDDFIHYKLNYPRSTRKELILSWTLKESCLLLDLRLNRSSTVTPRVIYGLAGVTKRKPQETQNFVLEV